MVCPPKLFVEVIATVLANPRLRARKQRNPRPRLQSKGIAMAKATWNGTVLAESNQTVEVEGNQYFPIEAVHREYLKPSNHQTVCPWKGTASYYDVEVNGQRNPNAAWYYPQPKAAASQIKDRVAFWKGVEVLK
jgi:uncharacterized protein (DUF427 family)